MCDLNVSQDMNVTEEEIIISEIANSLTQQPVQAVSINASHDNLEIPINGGQINLSESCDDDSTTRGGVICADKETNANDDNKIAANEDANFTGGNKKHTTETTLDTDEYEFFREFLQYLLDPKIKNNIFDPILEAEESSSFNTTYPSSTDQTSSSFAQLSTEIPTQELLPSVNATMKRSAEANNDLETGGSMPAKMQRMESLDTGKAAIRAGREESFEEDKSFDLGKPPLKIPNLISNKMDIKMEEPKAAQTKDVKKENELKEPLKIQQYSAITKMDHSKINDSGSTIDPTVQLKNVQQEQKVGSSHFSFSSSPAHTTVCPNCNSALKIVSISSLGNQHSTSAAHLATPTEKPNKVIPDNTQIPHYYYDETIFQNLENSNILHKAHSIIAGLGRDSKKQILSLYGSKCFDIIFTKDEIDRGVFGDPAKRKNDPSVNIYDPEKIFVIYAFVAWLILMPKAYTIEEFKRHFYANNARNRSTLLSDEDMKYVKETVFIRYAFNKRNGTKPAGQEKKKRKKELKC